MTTKNNQPPQKLSANQAAASLAMATSISQRMMGNTGQTMPQNPLATPSGQQMPDDAQDDAKFTELEGKMDAMRAEMESMVQKEISAVKDLIISTLNNSEPASEEGND